MKFTASDKPRLLVALVIIVIALLNILWLWQLGATSEIGKGDFLAYWSASSLLRNGQNPYAPELVLDVQQSQIGTSWDYPIMTWNPPSLLVFLLPLAGLPFPAAKSVWLIINLTIILLATVMLIRIYLPPDNWKILLAFLLFAVAFPQVLVGLIMGQVVSLVFLGLVLSMLLIKREQWFLAGASLILLTVKPQLIILVLIYLLAYMAQKRQYLGWLGLALAGLVSAAVLFLFRPEWILDYTSLRTIAPIQWATPTVGGLLSFLQISENARYLIIFLLPLPLILALYKDSLKMETAVAGLTLVTIPLTFFGWSYDQIMLLVPIAQIFAWMSESRSRMLGVLIAVLIFLSLVVNYYQRFQNTNEVYYLWIPLFWMLIYALTWHRTSRRLSA